jgi:hypothetical protein
MSNYEFSLNKNENKSTNLKKSNNTLFIHKLPKNESNKNIYTEIDNYFDDPEDFLSPDSKVIVGHKISISPIAGTCNIDNREKKYSKLNLEKHRTKTNISYSKEKSRLNKTISQAVDNNNNNIKFQVINNNQLKNIFDSFKEPSNINSFIMEHKLNNNNNSSILPRNISTSLITQNHYLDIKKKHEDKVKKMSRYLSRRTNKKINDLLINRIDFFRMKREIFNDIENSRPLEERYGQHKWVISLRRPDNFVGIRNAYVNIRNEHNPLWVNVREKYPLQKVLSIKPGYDLEYKDFVDFKKNQFLPESSFDNIKAVENLDDIEIKGKDLYKIEYKRELEDKNNKILHRVFFDNGKLIFDKEINETFGNETIYKNYEKAIYDDNNNNYFNSNASNLLGSKLMSNIYSTENSVKVNSYGNE